MRWPAAMVRVTECRVGDEHFFCLSANLRGLPDLLQETGALPLGSLGAQNPAP